MEAHSIGVKCRRAIWLMYDGIGSVHSQTIFCLRCVHLPICSFGCSKYSLRCRREPFGIPKWKCNFNFRIVGRVFPQGNLWIICGLHLLEDKVAQWQCCNRLAERYRRWPHWPMIPRKRQFRHSFALCSAFRRWHWPNNR